MNRRRGSVPPVNRKVPGSRPARGAQFHFQLTIDDSRLNCNTPQPCPQLISTIHIAITLLVCAPYFYVQGPSSRTQIATVNGSRARQEFLDRLSHMGPRRQRASHRDCGGQKVSGRWALHGAPQYRIRPQDGRCSVHPEDYGPLPLLRPAESRNKKSRHACQNDPEFILKLTDNRRNMPIGEVRWEGVGLGELAQKFK